MNKVVLLICATSIVCACDTKDSAAGHQSLSDSDNVSDMLKVGNLNACAHPDVEAFIAEKAKEDVDIPTTLVNSSDGVGGTALNKFVYMTDQAEWDRILKSIDIRLDDVSASEFKQSIAEMSCQATLRINGESRLLRYTIRPSVKGESDFMFGAVPADALWIDMAVASVGRKLIPIRQAEAEIEPTPHSEKPVGEEVADEDMGGNDRAPDAKATMNIGN